MQPKVGRLLRSAACAMALLTATAATAGPLGFRAKEPVADDGRLAAIQQALDEYRYLDAGQMINKALLAGATDPRMTLLGGNLSLAQGKGAAALAQFKLVDAVPATRAGALQGEGVALAMMGRSDDAVRVLRQAVAEDPAAWRAWNALGAQYDRRRDWPNAEAAYAAAAAAPHATAIVWNNRGFSRLLQNRPDEAVEDFVAALQKQPDLAAARTNLRFAIALRGDYDRAVAAGAQGDRSESLNNAGFAAMIRGDYDKAEGLLQEAIKAKSEFYERAAANLETALGFTHDNAGGADVIH